MDKTAIKNFSVWARNALIRSVTDKCGLIGVRADGIQNPLPQSTKDIQFFDAGTGAPYSISGDEIAKRDSLVCAIREKERDTDYKTAYNYIVEQVAYTWFNRLIAIRFMEVNDYLPSRIRVLSSEQEGKLEPDIIATPFDAEFDFTAQERETILQLKDRGQKEDMDALFRMLFVKQCDALHEFLPVLFQKVDGRDFTELLLNISFTDREGVVYHLVNDIAEANFDVSKEGQVEIIGWMYQYYNIEPKDETFALLKKNVKITKERIPAATQLFTPDWIVRYMVENSLGRLWVEGHPNDCLKESWKYYLEEAEQEADVQAQLEQMRAEYRTLNPENIKVIDPCMGSGHILVYCFDVLMQIYESQGYTQRDAAQFILEHNLYGLDIDDRAAQLAYFAVMMKARQYDRRILVRGIKPKVYAIQESNHFRRSQLQFFGAGMASIEANKAKLQVGALLDTLTDAKEYGSILKMESCDWDLLRRFAESLEAGDQMSLDTVGVEETQTELLALIEIAEAMAQKYHIVVTNPPYMGASGMSPKLSQFVKDHYPDTKSDMSTVCMEKSLAMCNKSGFMAMINIPVWMFITSYEKLRKTLVSTNTIVNMVHPGRGIFGSDFGTTSFVIRKQYIDKYCASYRRLFDTQGDVESVDTRENSFLSGKGQFVAQQKDYLRIPGIPIAYWVSERLITAFSKDTIADYGYAGIGMRTGDNNRFLRFWFEVSSDNLLLRCHSRDEQINSQKRWIPYNKGGEYRKWYGNNEYVVNWLNDGEEIKDNTRKVYPYLGDDLGWKISNESYYYRPGITWSGVTIAKNSFRVYEHGFIFDSGANGYFPNEEKNRYILAACLNNCIAQYILSIINPTINTGAGTVKKVPVILPDSELLLKTIDQLARDCVECSTRDWDSYETSWDFLVHPLVLAAEGPDLNGRHKATLADSYTKWEAICEKRFSQLKANEEELNRIFIDTYRLQDELTPDVEDKDVTVRKADLSRDIRSLLSYAVGCMFGRYSLDVEGLAYAGGDWDDSKYATFIPDEDNCIPITDEGYFGDDIVGLLCSWVKKVYGEETLEENLDFIAKALGNKGTTSREVIRNYFLNDFMKDHLKVYQKRPIYWLYDSGKQNGFKALIYMHRYDADTTGRIRADYLFKMQRAYENELKRVQDTIDGSSNSREVAQAEKRKEKLTKQLKETRDYDQKLAHLALARIPIDLDDGVKVNYEKIQTAPDGKKLDILAKI